MHRWWKGSYWHERCEPRRLLPANSIWMQEHREVEFNHLDSAQS